MFTALDFVVTKRHGACPVSQPADVAAPCPLSCSPQIPADLERI